jgi:hypothetical protein
MSRYPDSWEYSKDKGWIRPKPDKLEDPRKRKAKTRAKKKNAED